MRRSALPPLLRGQVVQVRLHRFGQLVAALDPLEPACRRTANVRYGLHAGSGQRISTRRLLVPRLADGI